jgi:anion exchange protein
MAKVKDLFERSGTTSLDETRQLFTQLDVLVHFDDDVTGWKEMARWLKYEENVEIGDRWSTPHVPTAALSALSQVRQGFADGRCAIGLGVKPPEGSVHKVSDAIMQTLRGGRVRLTEAQSSRLESVLLSPHKHKHRNVLHSSHHGIQSQSSMMEEPTTPDSPDDDAEDEKQDKRSSKKPFLRRRSGVGKNVAESTHNYPTGTTPNNLEPYKPNRHLTRKLPKSCEAANILVGQCSFLTETVLGFCRLDNAATQDDYTEVDVPTRFAFVALGPPDKSNIWQLIEIARGMAALLNDKVFCEVAYRSTQSDDLVAGIDEFLDDLTILPPSIWDPSVHLEPPGKTMTMDKIRRRLSVTKRGFMGPESPTQEEGASEDQSLMRSGRVFGGLIKDIRHRYPQYWSDIKDGFHIQCVASVVFLFFACITPIVTFGGLMGQKTDGYMGTMEMLLSGAVCGTCFALFSGQPLTIIGATGPLLIFESILYHICKENQIDFMSLRFWVGAWTTVILLVIVAFDLSALVRYITRFTEESFAILISVIFIVEAFSKILEIWHIAPVNIGVIRQPFDYGCLCVVNNFTANDTVTSYGTTTALWSMNASYEYLNSTNASETGFGRIRTDCTLADGRIVVKKDGCITEQQCTHDQWRSLDGDACNIESVTGAVPDVFLLSFILFIATFTTAMFLRSLRTGRVFPAIMKSTLADFAVLLAVLTWTGIDLLFGLDTPKLNVPAEFKPTNANRGWLINPAAVTHIWLIPLALIPALLGSILVFLDQQITAVIVNRKEHRLVKGHGYHLDLLVIAVLILICSFLGLPWFVAATVRAITHVRSLFRQSDVQVPGERPQMLGVREQRLTGVCIHLLIALSTQFTRILQFIPMPVLYGVFLYMGVTSLGGVQFIQRVGILLMPEKYQPDYIFLRHVKALRVHAFTAVQCACFVAMWVIKSIKLTLISFPVMLIVLMCVRKLLDYVFTQSDLYWLDHLLPDDQRRAKEDKQLELLEDNETNNNELSRLKEMPDSHTVEVDERVDGKAQSH